MRPRVQVDKVTRGTLILHNVMTTTMDNVKSSNNVTDQVVCIKQIYCGGLVGMQCPRLAVHNVPHNEYKMSQ